jgi:hypothetical protein
MSKGMLPKPTSHYLTGPNSRSHKMVKATHVNLVDLVHVPNSRECIRLFASEDALSEYTKLTKKYFPLDNAYAAGLLKHLLRQIIVPGARSRGQGGSRGGQGVQREGQGVQRGRLGVQRGTKTRRGRSGVQRGSPPSLRHEKPE